MLCLLASTLSVPPHPTLALDPKSRVTWAAAVESKYDTTATFFPPPPPTPSPLDPPYAPARAPEPASPPPSFETGVQWSAGNGMYCSACFRERLAVEAYCAAEIPKLGDFRLEYYSGCAAGCTAGEDRCPCKLLVERMVAKAAEDKRCCAGACACVPDCGGCLPEDPPPSPPPPPSPVAPFSPCTPLGDAYVAASMAQLQRFCVAFRPAGAPRRLPLGTIAWRDARRADGGAAPPDAPGRLVEEWVAAGPFEPFCEDFAIGLPAANRTACFGNCANPHSARSKARARAKCRHFIGAMAYSFRDHVCDAACDGTRPTDPCVIPSPPPPPAVEASPEPEPPILVDRYDARFARAVKLGLRQPYTPPTQAARFEIGYASPPPPPRPCATC